MGRQRAKKNIEPRLKSKLQKRYKKGVKSKKQNLSKREENRHLHNKIFYTGPVRYV